MATNTNYTFISNGILYTYKYDNTGDYFEVPSVALVNSISNNQVNINTSSIVISNTSVILTIRLPNTYQISSGNYYLNANGEWSQVNSSGNLQFNANLSYTFTNTITFSNLMILSVLSANGANGNPGQVLHSNGSGVYWSAISNGGVGTVTSINTGNGLFGGTIDTTGTISVLPNTGIIANSSGLFVNSSYISSIVTANGSNSVSNIRNIIANNVNTSLTVIDSIESSNVNTLEYLINAVDYVSSKYKSSRITITSDGTSTYLTEYAMVHSDPTNLVCTFSSDISGGLIRLLGQGSSSNVSVRLQRVILGSNTSTGDIASFISTGGSSNSGDAAAAYTNAVSYVDGKSYVNTSQLSANLSNYQTTAGLSANVAVLTSNNSNFVGGNSAATLRSYTDTKATTAYTNAISYIGNTYNTVTLEQFGAVGDDTTDDAGALSDCIDYLITNGGGQILLGNKKYRIKRLIDKTVDGSKSITIRGQGQLSSILDFSSNSSLGLKFSSNSTTIGLRPGFTFENFGLITSGVSTGTALEISYADLNSLRSTTVIENLFIGQSYDRLSDSNNSIFGYWNNGIRLFNSTESRIRNVHLIGEKNVNTNSSNAAFILEGSCTGSNIRDCIALEWTTGCYIGGDTEGINFNNNELVYCNYGFRHNPNTAGEPLMILAGNHINTSDVGIWLTNTLQSIVIDNNLFAAGVLHTGTWPNYYGIIIDGNNSISCQISRNCISKESARNGDTTVGINISAGSYHNISKNTIQGTYHANLSSNPITFGLVLNSPANNIIYDESPNSWMNVTLPFADNGVGKVFNNSSKNNVLIHTSGTCTVKSTDEIIIVNKTVSSSTAVNLPASVTTGQTYTIKDGKGDAATYNITITPASGTIDGAATLIINTNWDSKTICYNGSSWNVI